jgi:hypothetical protein
MQVEHFLLDLHTGQPLTVTIPDALLVQDVTILNIVGNFNTLVSVTILYCNIIILWDNRRICDSSLTETSLCGAYL